MPFLFLFNIFLFFLLYFIRWQELLDAILSEPPGPLVYGLLSAMCSDHCAALGPAWRPDGRLVATALAGVAHTDAGVRRRARHILAMVTSFIQDQAQPLPDPPELAFDPARAAEYSQAWASVQTQSRNTEREKGRKKEIKRRRRRAEKICGHGDGRE